jgi:hypothetical protein
MKVSFNLCLEENGAFAVDSGAFVALRQEAAVAHDVPDMQR